MAWEDNFSCHLVTAPQREAANRRFISGIRIPTYEEAANEGRSRLRNSLYIKTESQFL
jgi:hypothetical protein